MLLLLIISLIFKHCNAYSVDMDGLVLIEYNEPLPSDFIISNEANSSISNENYVVVDFEQSNESSSPELRIQLHNIYQVAALDRPCTLSEIIRRESTNASVIAFERLKDDKVVIVWYDELMSDRNDRRSRILVVHLESCIVINRDMNELKGYPIVVASVDGDFDVYVNDVKACNGVTQCAIGYNLKLDEYSQPKPLEIDLDWKSLKIERFNDVNLVTRGFKDNVYKVALINRFNYNSTALMSILAVNSRLEFLSSGLSFCWTMPSSVDISVRCAQFDVSGQLIFSSTVKLNYGRIVTLIHVHDMGKGKIFFVVGTLACGVDYDCWNLTLVQIHEDGTLKFESSRFRCSGERKKLAIFEVQEIYENATSVSYACRFGNGYAYDRNVVDSKKIGGKDLPEACQKYTEDQQWFCT